MIRTLDDAALEAIDLKADEIRILLEITGSWMNDNASSPVGDTWVVFERVVRQHLAEIDRLLNPPS